MSPCGGDVGGIFGAIAQVLTQQLEWKVALTLAFTVVVAAAVWGASIRRLSGRSLRILAAISLLWCAAIVDHFNPNVVIASVAFSHRKTETVLVAQQGRDAAIGGRESGSANKGRLAGVVTSTI